MRSLRMSRAGPLCKPMKTHGTSIGKYKVVVASDESYVDLDCCNGVKVSQGYEGKRFYPHRERRLQPNHHRSA